MIEKIERYMREKLGASSEGLTEDDLRSRMEEAIVRISNRNSILQQADLQSEEGLNKVAEAGVEISMELFRLSFVGQMLNEQYQERRAHEEILGQ